MGTLVNIKACPISYVEGLIPECRKMAVEELLVDEEQVSTAYARFLDATVVSSR